ncbi:MULTISPECIES: hypothetical protein [Sphingobacterium]|uniref:Uncharacterized protein n=1 Tax=Sphingobacterium tenebrionis TaxID=3111775 RepID=A0ABU8I4K2_9SPHI|nr:hypothetical protein [Sphingobacterium sp. CZ-2]
MRKMIIEGIRNGEDISMDRWLYENDTENGIPIESWLEANEEDL